jgi:hypothetical protein
MATLQGNPTTASREGYAVFVKADCPTCRLVVPVLERLRASGESVAVYVQDDPSFPPGLAPIDDRSLEQSFRHDVEIVPTIVRKHDERRAFGWDRDEWRALTGIADLGDALPALRPGCGSLAVGPGVAEALVARYGDPQLAACRIELGAWDDPIEACFDRGWSDGLPVVPPTDERILRMLAGTSRARDEVVGAIPPNLAPCTIEKVAINAVLAGCRPEYMPVLLAALDAALDPLFTLHGLTCSTCFSGPILVVNGPIARAIGMNAGINALGPGNRANATICRALNLIVRNVGGAIPGGIDRATLGGPHKIGLAFCEDESDPAWQPLAQSRGIAPGRSAVTLYQGDAMQAFIDQRSRSAPELVRSLAMALFAVGHPKLCEFTNAMLVLSPEHYAIFAAAGWDRARLQDELRTALKRPGRELVHGAQGVGEGIAAARANDLVDKFWPDGLLVVRAGGPAGLFSAILAGWTGGRFREDSQPVTKLITT